MDRLELAIYIILSFACAYLLFDMYVAIDLISRLA